MKKSKASGADINNGTTSKGPGTESKALTQSEQKQPTQGSDQTGYTRLQEWQGKRLNKKKNTVKK